MGVLILRNWALSTVDFSSDSSRLGKGILETSAFGAEGGVKKGMGGFGGSTGEGSLFA